MIISRRKGIVRIFEALLAIAIVLPFITVIQTFRQPTGVHDPELSDIGATVLTSLDESGILPRLLIKQDWVRLEAAVNAMLPEGVSFTLEISKVTSGGLVKLTTIGGGGGMQRRASISYVVNVYNSGAFDSYYLILTLSKG
jgi:hypothetical protein